ncbi:MAG: phosphopantothenoylcysteine decarboxylase, partial [Verrucomicrobiales bacterium]
VRRISNFSTGQLGAELASAFLGESWDVTCLVGEGTSVQMPHGSRVQAFGTVRQLKGLLEQYNPHPDLLLHAAALPDYRVIEIYDEAGTACSEDKIPSRKGRITLKLEPEIKIVSLLRQYFPDSMIVGWKYETDGSRDHAFEAGRRLIEEARLNAVVVNGPAFAASGQEFGLLHASASKPHEFFPDRQNLAHQFAQRIFLDLTGTL